MITPTSDSGAICQNTDGGYECICPSGMEGLGVTGSPCEESLVCGENEEASNCANKVELNIVHIIIMESYQPYDSSTLTLKKDCFGTCHTFLNNKPDRCPGQRNQDCVAGCVCAAGFVREKPNLGCVPESQGWWLIFILFRRILRLKIFKKS